jgi:hypothetical protein
MNDSIEVISSDSAKINKDLTKSKELLDTFGRTAS